MDPLAVDTQPVVRVRTGPVTYPSRDIEMSAITLLIARSLWLVRLHCSADVVGDHLDDHVDRAAGAGAQGFGGRGNMVPTHQDLQSGQGGACRYRCSSRM